MRAAYLLAVLRSEHEALVALKWEIGEQSAELATVLRAAQVTADGSEIRL